MSSRTPSDAVKHIVALAPASIATGATGSATDIDTQGFRWATIALNVGSSNTTSAGVLTVTQATAAGGTYTAMTDDGVNNGVAAQSAVLTQPAAGTGTFYGEIDLQQFERFLQFDFVNGGGAGAVTVASVDLWLHEPVDTKAQIADDLTSIKNTQQFQLLSKVKPAF